MLQKEKGMSVTAIGWSNKKGTAERACVCGTWKQHWINQTKKSWPACCPVQGCTNTPILGAHIINPNVSGERIVPMCNSCNGLGSAFNLNNVTLVSANVSKTCG